MKGLLILVVFIAVVVFLAIAVYNRLVALRNRFKNSFAQIDVQLKRRYDLIPNLVEAAKGYINHERETLERVIAARNQASSASSKAAANPGDAAAIQSLAGAETELTGSLGRLFALVESYPDLKSNQTVAQLMEELSSTENKVSFARQAFNDAVMLYNTEREKFPNVLIASSMGFEPAQLLESTTKAEEREAPRVSFS